MEEEYKILPVEEAETVIFDSAIDLGMDISETCIDMLLDESLVKDIPVLGTFYKAGKIGYSIGRITYILCLFKCNNIFAWTILPTSCTIIIER